MRGIKGEGFIAKMALSPTESIGDNLPVSSKINVYFWEDR